MFPQVETRKCYTYSMVPKEPKQAPLDIQGKEWQALELIADKWSLMVLYGLAEGKLRHGQLHRTILGISAKMLTQVLRGLERDGLVARKVYPAVPPKVEYSLTPLGQTVVGPLKVMCRWAEEHWQEVLTARSSYDEGREAAEHEA